MLRLLINMFQCPVNHLARIEVFRLFSAVFPHFPAPFHIRVKFGDLFTECRGISRLKQQSVDPISDDGTCRTDSGGDDRPLQHHAHNDHIRESLIPFARYQNDPRVEVSPAQFLSPKKTVKMNVSRSPVGNFRHYFRPAEVEQLLGNPARAKEKLGWEPEVKFEELVKIMVDGDLRLLDNPNYEIGF